MPLCFVVYAAIPDSWVLHAEEVAKPCCLHNGGTCDSEFHDSDRVKYWFSNADAWTAFKAHCALMSWI